MPLTDASARIQEREMQQKLESPVGFKPATLWFVISILTPEPQ